MTKTMKQTSENALSQLSAIAEAIQLAMIDWTPQQTALIVVELLERAGYRIVPEEAERDQWNQFINEMLMRHMAAALKSSELPGMECESVAYEHHQRFLRDQLRPDPAPTTGGGQ